MLQSPGNKQYARHAQHWKAAFSFIMQYACAQTRVHLFYTTTQNHHQFTLRKFAFLLAHSIEQSTLRINSLSRSCGSSKFAFTDNDKYHSALFSQFVISAPLAGVLTGLLI